jgi:hypothetical protein
LKESDDCVPTNLLYRTILIQSGEIEASAKADRVHPDEVVRLCETVRALVRICEKQDTMIEIAAKELNALKELLEHDERRAPSLWEVVKTKLRRVRT